VRIPWQRDGGICSGSIDWISTKKNRLDQDEFLKRPPRFKHAKFQKMERKRARVIEKEGERERK
jgi:hypothetical protein